MHKNRGPNTAFDVCSQSVTAENAAVGVLETARGITEFISLVTFIHAQRSSLLPLSSRAIETDTALGPTEASDAPFYS